MGLVEAMEATKAAREQAWALRRLLQMDEAKAKPKELLLVEKMRASKTADDYQAFLVQPDVIDMLRRGVAYFRQAT